MKGPQNRKFPQKKSVIGKNVVIVAFAGRIRYTEFTEKVNREGEKA
jgi:hypothetical protein